jgi:hypothetical protein
MGSIYSQIYLAVLQNFSTYKFKLLVFSVKDKVPHVSEFSFEIWCEKYIFQHLKIHWKFCIEFSNL